MVLIVGDGAAQLTIQEMGSMLRDKQKPLILLLNNEGYTVERAIHGPEQRYNDIALWDWQRLPEAFAPDVASRCRRVTQTSELREAMTESITSDTLTTVEVMLPKMDIPDFLRAVTQALRSETAAFNRYAVWQSSTVSRPAAAVPGASPYTTAAAKSYPGPPRRP